MPENIPEVVYFSFTQDIFPDATGELVRLCVELSNVGTREIHLLLSSNGGNINTGIDAYTLLRALPVKLVTHNIGSVDSVANILFLAGQERYAEPHGTFMFHGAWWRFAGGEQLDEPGFRDRLDSLLADHKRMATIIHERAKFGKFDEVMALFHRQETKDATYAKNHGLIHDIKSLHIPPGVPIHVIAPPPAPSAAAAATK